MGCCEIRATGPTPPSTVSMLNVGGGAEVYKTTTGPNPFEMRTFVSTGATVTITTVGDTVNLEAAPTVALANEGGSAEVYDTATSTPTLKNLRTIYSSDATVSVTQEATRINLKVTPATLETYFSEKSDIGSTNGTAYVVISTMDSIATGNTGEVWILFATCLICHPSGLSTVNTRINWQIETSAGVWADIETDLNTNEPQTIAVGQRSSPRARTYQVTLQMNAPRIRLRQSMSAAVATGGQVEYAKVSGIKR